MSVSHYLVGIALVVVTIAPLALGASSVRRWIVPHWTGPSAWLVDALVTIALLLTVSWCLGTVGQFRRETLPAVALAVGLGLGAWLRRREVAGLPAGDALPAPGAPSSSRVWNLLAVAACAGLAGQWVTRTATAYTGGITNNDSLEYHLAFAARFSQTGWLTRLHYARPEFPDTFHPANSETLHAVGMVLFERDVLSPVVNLGWVALVLLAAWALGRPFGVGSLSVLAASIVLASPVLNHQNAGSGSNDVAALFFVLCAAALLVHAAAWGPRTRCVALAGLAAGLGVGTKLTVAGLAIALTVGVVAIASRRDWSRIAVAWLAPLVLAGSFWYVRNWVHVGTPVPSIDLAILGLPAPRFEIVDRLGWSVADSATHRRVIRDWFIPGLRLDFGPAWWLTFGLAGLGSALAMLSRASDRALRVLGAGAVFGALVYLVTPTTALGPPGRPVLFASNLRYLTPALALALTVLPLAPSLRRGRRLDVLAAALTVALVATWSSRGFISAWPDQHLGLGLLVVLGTGAVGVVAVLGHLVGPVRVGVGLALTAVVLTAGLPVGRTMIWERYRHDQRFAWAQPLSNERIALAGFGRQYPLYGRDLSNRVQYVGAVGDGGEFHDSPGCGHWRSALRRERFTYVVLHGERVPVEERELLWTRSDPAASEVSSQADVYVFRFDHSVADDGSCASV